MKPLVIGSPRSGFALLCSILSHLQVMQPYRLDMKRRLLRSVSTGFSFYISKAIEDAFAEAGLKDDLIFNDNFRQLLGGPKWLHDSRADTACVRKYLGVRGYGDFTLIVNHPRTALECDDIMHSHSHPARWVNQSGYESFTKFASVRNPIGIINSSMLSINALTSEYIQRYLSPEDDTHELREQLALYKFTDLDFFKGICSFYKRYFDEFMPIQGHYIVMHWEDLIDDPTRTIMELARKIDLPVDEEHAAQIWQRLDHVNLTGAHKHNLRKGGGKVGDWKNWMVNEHLQIIEEFGFAPIIEALGYDPIAELDEAAYTPFQQQVAAMLSKGKVFPKYQDKDLFEFAFNKSNLDSEKFTFKHYEERDHTKVERSSFTDEDIVFKVWESADRAAGELNHLFETIIAAQYDTADKAQVNLTAISDAAKPLEPNMPKAHEAVMAQITQIFEQEQQSSGKSMAYDFNDPEPRLIRSLSGYNIVSYLGKFYCMPPNSGPIDLASQSVDELPGVMIENSFKDAYNRVKAKTASIVEENNDAMEGPSDYDPNHNLNFVKNRGEAGWLELARLERHRGSKTIAVRPLTPKTAPIISQIAAELTTGLVALDVASDIEVPDGVLQGDGAKPDTVLILEEDPDKLATALMEYVDRPEIRIIALVTDRFWQNRPLFAVSIPKAGTHLVFRLAKALGYSEGGICPDYPAAGHWYYVEHSNAHTPATKFFIDTVSRAPFGNRAHPFMRTPTLFNYRNPLDILVSEANYYHKDGKTAFAGYLDTLSFERRLLRLVDDPWLLGSIRDRVGMFAAWLEFSNVIPVSFEEMVGAAGGSSNEARLQLVWSLMLKLHAPGNPQEIAEKMSDRSSPTFRKGKIGGYVDSFTREAQAKFEALQQDFMEVYGYGDFNHAPALPARTKEFLNRPLRLSKADDFKTPFLCEASYLAHNLLAYGGRFYGIDTALGPFDLTQKSSSELSELPNASDLATLKMLIFEKVHAGAKAPPPERGPEEEDKVKSDRIGSFLGYEMFERDDAFVAISSQVSDIKVSPRDICGRPGVIFSRDTVRLRTKILLDRLKNGFHREKPE